MAAGGLMMGAEQYSAATGTSAMRRIAGMICTITFLLAGLAQADLIPPQQVKAEARMAQNPNLYDRSDQYCLNKKIKAACLIDAHPVLGGGPGRCERLIDRNTWTIDLQCQVDDLVLPEGPENAPFYPPHDFCSNGKVPPAFVSTMACPPQRTIPADRFCQGRQIGQACTLEYRSSKGKPGSVAGQCQRIQEFDDFYFAGWRQAQRTVIVCRPPGPAPVRQWTERSLLKKLLN